jgi:RNA polymerase sigma factor (sigma-70 family)
LVTRSHAFEKQRTRDRLGRRRSLVDEAELFEEHADRLLSAVSARVRTSPVNVEDACAFAWLQLLRYRPERQSAFGWLCTTAIREAIKLDRRARRLVEFDRLGEHPANEPRHELDHRLELLAAIQTIDGARLRPRERRLVALRGLGYSRRQMSELTGDSYRTLDRQLGRAQRKLHDARRTGAEVG